MGRLPRICNRRAILVSLILTHRLLYHYQITNQVRLMTIISYVLNIQSQSQILSTSTSMSV